MAELDYIAIIDAYKGLSVCFIISITISNCILIFKTIKKGRFLYTPKSLIMISMSIGDIFFALFALVILARKNFEDPTSLVMSCSIEMTYNSYLNFLMHFVYGMGIIVLAGELVQRNRTHQPIGNAKNRIAKAILYSALPWIFGLIIILPLTMVNAYVYVYSYGIEGCAFIPTLSRLDVMFVVSVILPAVMTVFVCFAVMFIKLSPVTYSSSPAAVTYQVPTQAVVTTSHYANGGHALRPYYINRTQRLQVYPSNGISQAPIAYDFDKRGLNNNGQIFTTSNAPYPAQQYPVQQYSAQQYPMQQYHAQLYPTPQYIVQYPPPQYPVQQHTAQSNAVFIAPTNIVQQQNTTVNSNPDKEKKVLLVVAIIYFLCVVPYASFILRIRYINPNSVVASICLFWLSVSRSLITPIIFLVTNWKQQI